MNLIDKYFGKYLERLCGAAKKQGFQGYFVNVVYSPEELEARLQRIEHLGLTQAIVQEVGGIQCPQELDRRLTDAWAEIRTVDQLIQEGYSRIVKTREIADLTAQRDDRTYVFQVTHINSPLASQVERRNPPGKRNTSPYGPLPEVECRLSKPLEWLFWDPLEEKNARFRSWVGENDIRCIVIVTSEEGLQDPFTRHLCCRAIRKNIECLKPLNFDELVWFPDVSAGAWFTVEAHSGATRCFADWNDHPIHRRSAENSVRRREVDLDSIIPTWKDRD